MRHKRTHNVFWGSYLYLYDFDVLIFCLCNDHWLYVCHFPDLHTEAVQAALAKYKERKMPMPSKRRSVLVQSSVEACTPPGKRPNSVPQSLPQPPWPGQTRGSLTSAKWNQINPQALPVETCCHSCGEPSPGSSPPPPCWLLSRRHFGWTEFILDWKNWPSMFEQILSAYSKTVEKWFSPFICFPEPSSHTACVNAK